MEYEVYENHEMGEMEKLIVYALALFIPFLLVFVEVVFPFPFIVEELAKLIMIMILVRKVGVQNLTIASIAMIGLIFGLSETVFYVTNAFALGSISFIAIRLVVTVPMHILTTIIMFIIGRRKRAWWIVAYLAGMLVHYVFNIVV